MKKMYLILIGVLVIVLMSSCAGEFIFREHHFGDTVDQIQAGEGEPDDVISEIEGWESIVYPDIQLWDGYEARLVYSLKDDSLEYIIATGCIDIKTDVADAKTDLKSLLQLGKPNKETDQGQGYKMLWKKSGYTAVLVVSSGSFTLVYGADTDRVAAYYETMMLTSLYRTDSNPDQPGL